MSALTCTLWLPGDETSWAERICARSRGEVSAARHQLKERDIEEHLSEFNVSVLLCSALSANSELVRPRI